jgi:hypothetical protein
MDPLTSHDLFLLLATSFWKTTLKLSSPGQESLTGLADVGEGTMLVSVSWGQFDTSVRVAIYGQIRVKHKSKNGLFVGWRK